VVKKIFLKQIYSKVDCAFYVGANNHAYYKAYGLPDDLLIFAPHAVDNDKFSANHSQEAFDLRRQLNLSAEDVLILFAGKFEAKKNPLLLVEAFKKFRKSNIHLLFVGNGRLEGELKDKANGDSAIHFMDFQNQSIMPAIYQAVDLFCLPSAGPGETWGLAVNEAMAAGKAIVVSDKVGCAVDLVKNDVNGEVFKSNSVDELADVLHRITTNKDKLLQMGRRSAEIIKLWSFTEIVRAIEERLNQN